MLYVTAMTKKTSICFLIKQKFIFHENHDIAIAMSSSGADPVLGLNILQGWLGVFKYLNQCHCPGWEYLNI